ncbi:Hypothetical protein SMAX5B_013931, partial [Scophthalmus maximus]
ASVEERVAAGINRYTGVLVCILGNTQGEEFSSASERRSFKAKFTMDVGCL